MVSVFYSIEASLFQEAAAAKLLTRGIWGMPVLLGGPASPLRCHPEAQPKDLRLLFQAFYTVHGSLAIKKCASE